MSSAAVSPLSAYRQILRATRIAFQGDFRTLLAARSEARKQFDEHRKAGVDTQMQIQHALDTAQILRTNVVQGVRDSEDEQAENYTLRIHEEIERGDNDTIKQNGKDDPVTVKPCSPP